MGNRKVQVYKWFKQFVEVLYLLSTKRKGPGVIHYKWKRKSPEKGTIS